MVGLQFRELNIVKLGAMFIFWSLKFLALGSYMILKCDILRHYTVVLKKMGHFQLCFILVIGALAANL